MYVKGTSNRFIKTGGTIYGDRDTTHTAGTDENTATESGGPYGHAVFYTDGGTVIKHRNADAGPAVRLDTNDGTGWE